MRSSYPAILGLTLALALGSAASETPPAGPSEPIKLSVLSYNTHGLPAWIAFDDPASRLPQIGRLTNGYDVALLQEDFAYHEKLLEGASHPVVERGNPTRFGPTSLLSLLCGQCGSGLTTLKRFARQRLVDVHREAFGRCSGWVLSWTGSDCWATKGMLSTRLRLPNGAEVDFYNVHLDAGMTRGDQRVRRHQLERLKERVAERTNGQAVVVAGDFNLRSDNPRHVEILTVFQEELGLREARIELGNNGWRRQVDYIFFRSGDQVALELLDSGLAEEFVHEGAQLSDHPALFARFRVRPSPLEVEHVATGPESPSGAPGGAAPETGL